jgi:sugar phosphate permease
MAAGVTAVPAVLIHPREVEFGWDRAAIALAVSINVLRYGLAGPFAGGLMRRFGPRRVMLTSLALSACGVAATTSAVAAAGTLALMGGLEIVGTLGSGWLSDRCDTRLLLAWYDGLRGVSLLVLPYADDLTTLALLGVVYGLDWIATVPPTAGLASEIFGTRAGPIRFGWIFFGHQVGAALAAYAAGLVRVWFGDYGVAVTTAGLLAVGAAGLARMLRQRPGDVPAAVGLPAPTPASR